MIQNYFRFVQHELEFFLVDHNLKPAMLFSDFGLEYSQKRSLHFSQRDSSGARRLILRKQADPRALQIFEAYLNDSLVSWRRRTKKEKKDVGNVFPLRREEIMHCYFVAGTQERLDHILTAESDRAKGLVLGYPEKACEDFGLLSQKTFACQLVEAIHNGFEVPNWFAYVSHVPLDFSFDENDCSSSLQGKEFRDYTRREDYTLATRVEADFFSRRLPNMLRSGGADIPYRFPESLFVRLERRLVQDTMLKS